MRDAELLRYLVLAAQREGNRILTDGLRPLGVTPSQAEVLRVLFDHGAMTLKALGAHLICETGSPSRLLATLVDSSLVERTGHPTDGRAVQLHLTAQGVERAEQIRTLETALYDDIDRRTGQLDLRACLELLHALVEEGPTGRALRRRQHRTPEPS